MQYGDLVAIILTAVSVIITVLALFIGVLAIWGYSQFQKMTQEASAAHLERMLKEGSFKKEVEALIIEHVSSQLKDGDLRSILVERIDLIIQKDASWRASGMVTDGDENKFSD